jgi:hypothetical protein
MAGLGPVERRTGRVGEILTTNLEVYMLLALTCAICAAVPVQPPPPHAGTTEMRFAHAEERLVLPAAPLPPDLKASPVLRLSQVPLVPEPPQPQLPGSGDGDHSDHMSTMWLVMGGMMVVMMVGVGVYFMGHGNSVAVPLRSTGVPSPAMRALPVSVPGGG